eukprot:Nitzschia sp. Nitz4//scaffold6_size259037//75745//79502//NITZ4_001058-RA/size259037-processed-gene-0.254-mRNA-1//-1//CDS//3329556845//3462//frame0
MSSVFSHTQQLAAPLDLPLVDPRSSSFSMATAGSIPTTSSNSLNSYSPIATLERQYQAPVGQRLVIGVQANSCCALDGGVESILRLRGNAGALSSEQGAQPEPSFDETKEDDFDAFGFLHDNPAAQAQQQAAANAPSGQPGKGLGGFFRKAAASASASLERQMQGLAVRMDKGRNADLLRVAMYDPVTEELLGVTEPLPLPELRQDMRFKIPLVVPGKRRQQQLLLKLWIQSGAALLQTTKAGKCYLLGSVVVDPIKLPQGIVTPVSLSSNLVVGGQLHLCVMPDTKFPVPLHRGWSLSDPDMSAYSTDFAYLPLDQPYIFSGNKPEHWLVATERATESTIALPIAAAFTDLAARAAQKSLYHAQSVAKLLRANRHDFKDDAKATCNLSVVGINAPGVRFTGALSIAWRRPDSIFELELIANEKVSNDTALTPFSLRFYPKVCTEGVLPGILQAFGGHLPSSGYLLGALYFCLNVQRGDQIELWESVIGMEGFTDVARTMEIPLHRGGQPMGNLQVQISVVMPTQREAHKHYPASDGLISLVGLENYNTGVNPVFDSDVSPGTTEQTLRQQQLDTMGLFYTTPYMDQHLVLRQEAMEGLQERARAYKQALVQPQPCEAHETKTPKAFRPSSSRPEAVLSGLPFNCHIVHMSINIVDSLRSVEGNQEYPGATFHNITHGAPADHARGFGNILAGISHSTAAGGLRRLEAKRLEFASALDQAQNALIAGVGSYLGAARKSGRVNHIPARHSELQALRWKVFEAAHSLHHVTWMCSVRRANVFSQSLGLAVSSYLASISDTDKVNAGWPEVWRRHGYMTCFEGLLSAAGKELGMIEDARTLTSYHICINSVAISMLRMVRIVLMPDTGIPSKAVFVPSSSYLKWVNIFPSGQGKDRHFLLQIGVDAGYYNERVPASLKNGTAVQLYPLLYQVGVDIRQWGAHTGSNLGNNILKQNGKQEISVGGLVDDEDDDTGVVDADVLVALNYEALRKMNAYAHAIRPQDVLLDKVQAAMVRVFSPQYAQGAPEEQQDLLPVHPTLAALHSHIMSSAGRMNHSILDEAATLSQQLGGGGLVFCKSGKDRTAMHVTYKQAQFAARYRGQAEQEVVLRDATLLRTYGTRLPICEKNVGQAKYAFNSLQVQFMPDALKPPMNTLAGFLKGGRLFGEGAIET